MSTFWVIWVNFFRVKCKKGLNQDFSRGVKLNLIEVKSSF
jgi:hypothetical protein